MALISPINAMADLNMLGAVATFFLSTTCRIPGTIMQRARKSAPILATDHPQ